MWNIFVIKFSSIIKKELGRAVKYKKMLEEKKLRKTSIQIKNRVKIPGFIVFIS
jgi:hypothetical protein